VSIGESLAEARRQAGLTVGQVSQETRIRESIIRAIEQGDFTPCGGDFYARGHIRAIAEAVGVDPGPLIEEFDERWRSTIKTTVLAGQEAGEFKPVDAEEFAVTLSALLDGMAVQIALEDPDVPPSRAYDLAMRYAAGQLGFTWDSSESGRPEREPKGSQRRS